MADEGSRPDALFPVIYGELRHVARPLPGSRAAESHAAADGARARGLDAASERAGGEWQGRTHGLALGAQAMRRLLVDHGRHQKRDKRGGGVQPLALDDLLKASETGAVPVEDLLTLEAALTRLEAVDARAAQVVDLRFFSGMSNPEVAEHLASVAANRRRRLDARAGVAQTRAGRRAAETERMKSCRRSA